MASKTAINVWMDCDPGCDDAFALLLMAFSKNINLLGISTVSGNQVIDNMTRNTLKILDSIGFVSDTVKSQASEKNELDFDDCLTHGGLKIPVIEGCGLPFFGKPFTASNIHGITGLEGDWPPIKGHAYEYVKKISTQNHFTTQIFRYFKSLDKPITILATGPLTNIALLMFNHPEIKNYIEKIVFMGGSMSLGNTGPLSEFNIHADPISVSMVCESGVPVYMIPLDCSNDAKYTEKIIENIKAISSRFADLFANLITHLSATCPADALHDPVAAFYLVDPSCFESKLIRVDVECNKTALNYAQTVCDFHGKTDKLKNVTVCYKTNVEAFWERMIGIIAEANKSSPLKN